MIGTSMGAPKPPPKTVGPLVLEELAHAVDERFGLKLGLNFRSNLARVARSLVQNKKADDLPEVIYRLKTGSDDDEVVKRMRNAASVQETYFFRAPDQLNAIVRTARSLLQGSHVLSGQRPLRVWCAACATGEEPYSLAYLFRKAFPELELKVVATDMNDAALERGRQATYSKMSFRGTVPENYKDLFAKRGDSWSVVSEFRRLVTFTRLNLVKDAFPAMLKDIFNFDVISCRNVLIYLDTAHVPEVMRKLSRAASPTAVLAVTPAESSAAEFAVNFSHVTHGIFTRSHSQKTAPARRAAPVQAERSRPSTGSGRTEAGPARTEISPERPPPPSRRPKPSSPADGQAKAPPPMDAKHPDAIVVKVREAAEQQGMEAAVKLLETAAAEAPDSPWVYLARGQILLDAGDLAGAVRSFKGALFLDRTLAAAELGMAQALVLGGHGAQAEPHFRRVLNLLVSADEADLVSGLNLSVRETRRLAELPGAR
jgi:chemotaxis protein methyltransferase CheR